jgi:hypothetical protein
MEQLGIYIPTADEIRKSLKDDTVSEKDLAIFNLD